MKPTLRKPVGVLLMLVLMTLWCVGVASLSGWIGEWHALVQLPAYLLLGVAWIYPMRPLLRWMETGEFRNF